MFKTIRACRICGNPNLEAILHLGDLHLTGVFPRNSLSSLTHGPLELVKCHPEGGRAACGLVQLRQTYALDEMYGANYGYRSSLNRSMVEHLRGIAGSLSRDARLEPGDIVLDIGSNDGTLLSFFDHRLTRVGIDPTAAKFRQFYEPDIEVIPEFFSADRFRSRFGSKKAKLVTSIAMFYDLEHPPAFVEQVRDVLHDEGLWHFEQSYLPLMLQQNSYDTICHEHLEYYALRQIQWMTDRAGLVLVDVGTNDVNGGSFAVTAAKASLARPGPAPALERFLRSEAEANLETLAVYRSFRERVDVEKRKLQSLLRDLTASGKKILGYGASTKGNVILQYCGITQRELPAIVEVNEDKFGCLTPGSKIPIIPEAKAREMRPDYFLVLPWHFKEGIVQREEAFLEAGGKLVFPLPELEIVAA